ncbi:hypothetical protein SAMN04487891_11056 [Flagellimonas taeanensis]|uniref:Uncharacterized protein n=1 Tax=Flagellimonas taeanensis TaxID=1005926 RepID=A0A1M7B8X7_9FLAO|nr:hypothetical protein [Allomuricauda taeanensis]SFC38427.1 hypothetical protein SAMN04487891_11056 [Allomuricauda taeanensis]SHL51099.1 hypothetical protein SAMN05216293_3615 [Allomuricauda taeanensis]
MKNNQMVRWMILGCVLVLGFYFIWPFLGIQGYGSWLFFGLIFLICLLPMLRMGKKNKNDYEGS